LANFLRIFLYNTFTSKIIKNLKNQTDKNEEISKEINPKQIKESI